MGTGSIDVLGKDEVYTRQRHGGEELEDYSACWFEPKG